MWFLKNINQRNRLRIILEAAACLNIVVPSTVDIYAHPDDTQGSPRSAAACAPSSSTSHWCWSATRTRPCRCTSSRKDTRQLEVVQHFKGCVVLSQHAGAIPVHVSESHGLVVLSADVNFRAGAGLANDTLAFS